MTKIEIAEQVVVHALKNYEESGWDFIVECFTRDEIAQTIHAKHIVSVREAIAYFSAHARLLDERRREIISRRSGN